MTFDTGNHTSAIPVGLGPGQLIQLDGGYTLNIYAEAQPSLYRSGVAALNYHIFTPITAALHEWLASFLSGLATTVTPTD
jgi:hypothetical protein